MFFHILFTKGFFLLPRPLLVFLLTLHMTSARSQISMSVVPNRVVFSKATDYAEVNLTNTSPDTVTYLVNPKQYRMHQDGGFEEILSPDAGQYFASDYIMFYPRRITLAPGQTQIIELRLANTEDLEQKEYRSHMHIRTEVKKTTGYVETEDAHGITASLIPSLGITIPLIIRRGDLSVDVAISDVSFNDSVKPKVAFVLNRSGNMSVYGNIVVEHVSPEMKVTKVATAQGVAVYTPNRSRYITVELDRKKQVDYNHGSLRVTYDAESGEVITVTEASLMLRNDQSELRDAESTERAELRLASRLTEK